MTPDCFLDTNVLVYAAMARFSAPQKYRRARQIMAETHFAISGQVLQEFYVTVTKKSGEPLTVEAALKWLDCLRDRPRVAIELETVVRGVEVAQRYQLSYWDGAILAAADLLGAPILYTEDLNDGQVYGTVRAVNPFKTH